MEKKIVPLTRDCADGRECPGVIAVGDDEIVVRGPVATASELPGVPLGDGEGFVRIPVEVFREAARAYGE